MSTGQQQQQQQRKKQKGRPSKCTAQYVPRFLKHIAEGQTIRAAAALAGLHIDSIMRWLEAARDGDERYFEFSELYARARGKAQSKMVAEIRRAGTGDWRATAWLLERMFVSDFSLKQTHEISGPNGGPIPLTLPVEVVLSNDERFKLGEQKFEYSRS
jgi:hypothetical protein